MVSAYESSRGDVKGGRLKYGEDMEVGYVVYPRGDIIRSTRSYSYYRLQLGERGGGGWFRPTPIGFTWFAPL